MRQGPTASLRTAAIGRHRDVLERLTGSVLRASDEDGMVIYILLGSLSEVRGEVTYLRAHSNCSYLASHADMASSHANHTS